MMVFICYFIIEQIDVNFFLFLDFYGLCNFQYFILKKNEDVYISKDI